MRALNLAETEISAIHAAWIASHSINKISAAFHHGTEQIRELADRLDWPSRSNARDPLPAGHEATWSILWRGSALAGVAYPQMPKASSPV